MTAGMNTRNLDAGRISLPRAGFGALLAGTLLAGSLLGAAAYATITMASANAAAAAHAAAIAAALPNESTIVHDARIAVGHGQLVGDATRAAAVGSVGAVRQGQITAGNGPLAGDIRGVASGTAAVGVTRNTAFPAGRDGFGFDQATAPVAAPVGRDSFGFGQAAAPAPTVTLQHAPGRGPLQ